MKAMKKYLMMLLAVAIAGCSFDTDDEWYDKHFTKNETEKDTTEAANINRSVSSEKMYTCRFTLATNLNIDYGEPHDMNELRVTVEEITIKVIEGGDTITYHPDVSPILQEPKQYTGWYNLPEGLTSPEYRNIYDIPIVIKHNNSFLVDASYIYIVRSRNKETGEEGQYMRERWHKTYTNNYVYDGNIVMQSTIRLNSIVIIPTIDGWG